MTRTTNARLAGFMLLFYIATGIASMVLFGQATSGEGTAAKLASIAQHATTVRLTVVLTLLTFVDAVVLAVALYALTRDEDRDLALLALCCRVSEGVIAAISTVRTLGLLSVATSSTAAAAPDAAAANALGALLLKMGSWTGIIARNLLRRGQHALLLPLPACPDHPRPAGLAGHTRLDPVCKFSAPYFSTRSPQARSPQTDSQSPQRFVLAGAMSFEGTRENMKGLVGKLRP